MAFLKGQDVNGFVQIDRDVEFTGRTLARALGSSPWGTQYFVDSVSGASTNTGLTPSSALTTVTAALALAGRGDTIYVRPAAYTVGTGFGKYSANLSIALAQSDLSIIGCNNMIRSDGGARLAATTTYAITCVAPGLHVANIAFFGESMTGCVLLEDDANIVKAGGNFFSFFNCCFKGGYLTLKGGSDCGRIHNSAFEASTVASAYECGILLTTTVQYFRRLHIVGNTFSGRNGAAPATAYIKSSSCVDCVTDILIAGNFFMKEPANNKFLDFSESTANEGLIAGNFFGPDIDLTDVLCPGGISVSGNFDVGGFVEEE